MAEKPILFNTQMVKAIIAGRKTQTRRVVKPVGKDEGFIIVEEGILKDGELWPYRSYDGESWDDGNGCEVPLKCPYGGPGDTLWVRETFTKCTGCYGGNGVVFKATCDHLPAHNWKPSSRMPREYSRIDLRIWNVRVERLQAISEADARAEGVAWHTREIGFPCWYGGVNYYDTARDAFAELWDSINAKRGYGWAENPWVWVVEFRRQEAQNG